MFSESEMVIVRGVKKEWFEENIVDMRVLFGGQEPRAIPNVLKEGKEVHLVGLYLEAPRSAITHIGIIESIEDTSKPDWPEYACHLKALIRLAEPVNTEHPIRCFEYKTLGELGIKRLNLEIDEN